MTIRLAYNTNSWGPYPALKTMLQDVKKAGWDGWEVRQPLDWLGSAERTLAIIEEAGLPAAGVSWHQLKVGDPVCIELNKRRIELTLALKADIFVFAAPPRARHRIVSREEISWLTTAAKELSDYGANMGVQVTFHPHTGTIGLSRQEWDQVMEAAPNLKLCLDFAHILLGGDEIAPVLKDYKDRIAYAHLHDFGRWAFVNLGEGKQYDIPSALLKN
jgi:sugar phosphate isomerase/epimerase